MLTLRSDYRLINAEIMVVYLAKVNVRLVELHLGPRENEILTQSYLNI